MPSDQSLTWPDPLTLTTTSSTIATALRTGLCPSDRLFDQFLPYELQQQSARHWTPIIVAYRVAQWFAELSVFSVSDIGSGAGKFALVAAMSGRCRVIGVEQHPQLVLAAQQLARTFDIEERIQFRQEIFGEVPAPLTDAYYLYNPFGENLRYHFDNPGEILGFQRYTRDIAATTKMLHEAPVGTVLCTYNGFGGRIPTSFRRVKTEEMHGCMLRLWRKTSRAHQRKEH